MTTKAIEAGARAINQCRKPENTRGSGWASDSELAKACIEAAITSGELVPASAVAEMKSDLDALASEYAEISRIVGRQGNEERNLSDDVRARIASAVAAERERCAKVAEREAEFWQDAEASSARIVAAAIRSLEPASGEYVLVPREPSEAMVNAACGAWVNLHPSFEGEKSKPTAGEVATAIFKAMLTAATSNGSGK